MADTTVTEEFTLEIQDPCGGAPRQFRRSVDMKPSVLSGRKYSMGLCTFTMPGDGDLPPAPPFSENLLKFNLKKVYKVNKLGGNYSQNYESEPFRSARFDYKLQLKVFITEENVSIGIRLVSGKNDRVLCWPFSKIIRITLLNNTDNAGNISREIDPENSPSHAWSRPQGDHSQDYYTPPPFISTKDLREFLHNKRMWVVVKLCDRN